MTHRCCHPEEIEIDTNLYNIEIYTIFTITTILVNIVLYISLKKKKENKVNIVTFPNNDHAFVDTMTNICFDIRKIY